MSVVGLRAGPLQRRHAAGARLAYHRVTVLNPTMTGICELPIRLFSQTRLITTSDESSYKDCPCFILRVRGVRSLLLYVIIPKLGSTAVDHLLNRQQTITASKLRGNKH